jgi:hypothetical protein
MTRAKPSSNFFQYIFDRDSVVAPIRSTAFMETTCTLLSLGKLSR